MFNEKKQERLSSTALVAALLALEESPWGDLRGKPLDARRLATRLKPYGIGPKQLRLDSDTTAKGYQASDFKDSWDRYLPPGRETSETRETDSDPKYNPQDQNVSDVSLVSVPEAIPESIVGPNEVMEWTR